MSVLMVKQRNNYACYLTVFHVLVRDKPWIKFWRPQLQAAENVPVLMKECVFHLVRWPQRIEPNHEEVAELSNSSSHLTRPKICELITERLAATVTNLAFKIFHPRC